MNELTILYISLIVNIVLLICIFSPNIVYFLNKKWFVWKDDNKLDFEFNRLLNDVLIKKRKSSLINHPNSNKIANYINNWKNGSI